MSLGESAQIPAAGNDSLSVSWMGVHLVATPPLLWLMPHLTPRAPFPWNNFLFNAPVVALLTWVVMPLLARLLRGWMHPVG